MILKKQKMKNLKIIRKIIIKLKIKQSLKINMKKIKVIKII
jgi:hypothetical protein